jgi:hypothetical protein
MCVETLCSATGGVDGQGAHLCMRGGVPRGCSGRLLERKTRAEWESCATGQVPMTLIASDPASKL